MAKALVNYSEFWYLSRIFHSLFYKLISIFIFLLLTFSIYSYGRENQCAISQGANGFSSLFDRGHLSVRMRAPTVRCA